MIFWLKRLGVKGRFKISDLMLILKYTGGWGFSADNKKIKALNHFHIKVQSWILIYAILGFFSFIIKNGKGKKY